MFGCDDDDSSFQTDTQKKKKKAPLTGNSKNVNRNAVISFEVVCAEGKESERR
jgi:hypothetical protein